MREVLQFQPIYQERVWGGRRLQSFLGRDLPPGPPIGESWEIVDRPEAQSRVRGGPYNGTSLRSLLERHSAEVMGPEWPASKPFPLLVKWLDCSERLSLQVHPPASVAASLGGEAKTENWYVAHSAPGASLFVGLKPGVTLAAFTKAIADGTAEEYVNKVPVAGNLILEIQQNSDTTYRLHDWGRVGLDGKPRQLHVEESLRSILWDTGPPELVRASPTSGTIASCEEFTMRRVVLGKGESLRFKAGEQPRILTAVAGGVGLGGAASGARALAQGDSALIPRSADLEFVAPELAIVLVTESFT
jgi:mannose-6-phosphate isomerase